MGYYYQWDDEHGCYNVYRRATNEVVEIHDSEIDAINAVDRLEDEEEQADEPVAPVDYPEGTFGIFEDFDQAQTHINGRLVTFNNVGKKVSRILLPENPGDKARVELKHPAAGMILKRGNAPVVDNAPVIVDIDDAGFDSFRFNPLGWSNLEDGATLLELRPIRQTRRGYGDENVGVYRFPDNHNGWIERPDNVFVPGLFAEEGFNEMLGGIYPTFEDAVATLLVTEGAAVAVSPLLCIQSDQDGHVWLWRYGDRIGYVPDAITVRLGKRWRFLQEELQECGTIPNGVVVK